MIVFVISVPMLCICCLRNKEWESLVRNKTILLVISYFRWYPWKLQRSCMFWESSVENGTYVNSSIILIPGWLCRQRRIWCRGTFIYYIEGALQCQKVSKFDWKMQKHIIFKSILCEIPCDLCYVLAKMFWNCYWKIIQWHFITMYLARWIKVDINEIRTDT